MKGAVVTCVAPYGIDGGFDYDLADVEIVFGMTISFRESLVSERLFRYMISCLCAMVVKYNNQFLAIDKGLMSFTCFIAKES